MLKNYLLLTFRSLWKSKMFVLINVLGMGISIACAIVAYLNYDYNQSYDVQHENAASIYRVNFVRDFQGNVTRYGMAPQPLGPSLKGQVAGVERVIRYIPQGGNIRINDDLFQTGISYADEGFLDLFTFPLKAGNKADFAEMTNIFISSELAVKYFGQENPIGKPLLHLLDSGQRDYVVAGVFEKMPPNSSFQFDAVTHIDNYFQLPKNGEQETSWKSFNTLFLEIKDPSRIPQVEQQLQAYVAPQNQAREDFKVTRFYLDPFEGMAIRAAKEDLYGHWFNEALPAAAVVAPTVMALMVLLIACFNFTNTAIAMSSRRLKEIGIRKVMGGARKELVIQFLTENMVLCLISMGVGLLVAEILVPTYNQMWDFLELDMNYLQNIGFLGFVFVLLLLIGLLAGSYPAFFISKFEPVSILKGTFKFGGTNWFTKSLLTLQFSISLVTLISAVGFIQNAQYQQEVDKGFQADQAVYTYVNGQNEFETYRNAIQANPEIIQISGTKHHLMSSYLNDPVKHESAEREVDIYEVGHDYFDVMGMTLLDGRGFAEDSESDRREAVVVNETFSRVFGWENPIGKRVVWQDSVQLYVVGVIKDFYGSGLWEPIEPSMFRLCAPKDYTRFIVKAKGEHLKSVDEYMGRQWKEVFPNRIYNSRRMDEQFSRAAMINNNIVKLFGFLAVVAMLLSASGLFSLVSLNILKRMKEIGVRKVLGASVGNIVANLNKQFAMMLSIAMILGCVLGYLMVDLLMSSIWVYYTKANAITFLLGIAVILLVSAATVSSKIIRAASVNPVKTLRSE